MLWHSAMSTSVRGTVGSAERVCWHGNALSALLSLHEYDQMHGEPTRPPDRGYRGSVCQLVQCKKFALKGIRPHQPHMDCTCIINEKLYFTVYLWSYYKERALKCFYFLCRNTWMQLRREKAQILINTHWQLSFSLEDELHPTMCFRSKRYYSHILLVCGFHFVMPSE